MKIIKAILKKIFNTFRHKVKFIYYPVIFNQGDVYTHDFVSARFIIVETFNQFDCESKKRISNGMEIFDDGYNLSVNCRLNVENNQIKNDMSNKTKITILRSLGV